jgi:shikimate kinase
MKLVLIGFMGSGKTTVAEIIARRCNLELIELDEIIVTNSDYKSIAEMIENKGETFFRDHETQVCLSVKDCNQVVISTGGGAIFRPENLQSLKANNAVLVFLDTDFSVISDRLSGATGRPLFTDLNKAKDLFENRQKGYKSAANYTINTNNLSVEDVADKIISLFEVNN